MAGRIAVVGAGPSGCYVAQALLKAAPALEVDVIDALPVPFGLVRYGVAADHQGTKAVARQFARIFERQGARFFGNVRVGRDITLRALREAYDAVVLAAGLSGDRQLSIPGNDLPGVYGSASLTRALNEHPNAAALPNLGPRPLILGNGNVAIDLLRLLCKTPTELEGTDLGEQPTAWLAGNAFESITIVGRSPAARAKFDPVMIRELGKLQNVSIRCVDLGQSDVPEEKKRIEALIGIDGHGSGPLKVVFRFGLLPLAVEGDDHVTGLRVEGADGQETLPASSILAAIGFDATGDLDRSELLHAAPGGDAGKLADGLYSVGWFRRGARGTIPDSRAEAQDTAALILGEMRPDPTRAGSAIFSHLQNVVDYAGWQRIDAMELARATPQRCRQKLATTAELLCAAAKQDDK